MTLGIRGTPQILILLLGVWLKILKILGFDRRRVAAAGGPLRGQGARLTWPAAASQWR